MFEVAGPTPLPRAPKNLPGAAIIRESSDDAIDAAAADLLLQAHNCVRAFGDFHLAVAPRGVEPLLQRLMYDPALRELPWQKTQLWLVEDSHLPEEDPARDATLLTELLAQPADIPPSQFHAIRPENPDAAPEYERRLREHLGWREKGHDRLDYVLFGIAEDPISSLLSDAAPPDDSLVRTYQRPNLPCFTSMTHRLILASRFVGVLCLGRSCRTVLAPLVSGSPLTDRDDARSFPFSGQRLLGGEMRWYFDLAACPPPANP